MKETAKAVGKNLSISTKNAIEICSFIRGKSLQKAKEILERVIEKKQAIPFKRFTEGAGHKKGLAGGGKFPVKACAEILNILKLAEANASYKGLNTASLVLKHVKADKASKPIRYSRHRGRLMKRTHVEVIVEEAKKKAEEGSEKK